MDRRRFLLTPMAGALAAEAQQASKVYRIGMLWNTPTPPMQDVLRQGLRELGWIEGQNFLFERRYSEGRNDRHPAGGRAGSAPTRPHHHGGHSRYARRQGGSTIICVRRDRLERRRLTHAIFQAFEWRQERRDRDSARPVTYRHRTRA